MNKKIIEKKEIKELVAPFIMSFLATFMFLIYEPITTYASNVTDYWFGFNALLKANCLLFVIIFLILLSVSIIIYYISKLLKMKKIYEIFLIVFSICLSALYIQGNYLSGSLPTLDGAKIYWDKYEMQNIISILMWLVVVIINVIICRKFKSKYKKIISYEFCTIFIMLFVSFLVTIFASKDLYAEKGKYISTTKNINMLSENKNFLILLVDCVDSREFEKVVNETDSDYVFDDFTYFPDTMSTYGFTRDSVPYIFSGIWYEAETPYNQYYENAFNNSKLFSMMKSDNYDINVYDEELMISNNKKYDVKNVELVNSKIDLYSLFKQEVKYDLFKYLPFGLKKYSSIETLNYSKCKKLSKNDSEYDIFSWNNIFNYEHWNKIKLQKNNYFHFLHIEGAHFPYDLNKNLEKLTDETNYDDKLGATISMIDTYLTRIKDSGMYDNSVIIILSDHGQNDLNPVGRQNPILYIKGIDEHHKLEVSNKKVSYVDLNESIYKDLLDNKKSFELLENVDNDRIRRYLWYKDYDDMYEQTLDGHAWETEKLINTGKRYKR